MVDGRPVDAFPLYKLLTLAEPTSNAKYVALETIYALEQMPGQQGLIIGGDLKSPYIISTMQCIHSR